MTCRSRWAGVVVVCVALIGTARTFAQDWPQWRGPNRDGKVAGFAAPDAAPKSLVKKWSIEIGSGDATPALVGERLYAFVRQDEDEVTICLNASDGEQVWKDKYAAKAVTGAASRHPGPRSSPAVAGGRVVTLGVAGVLSCLDAASGKVLWRKDPFAGAVPTFFTAMSPMIVDQLVVAHLGAESKGALIAYDLESGDEKWRWDGEGPHYASPVLLTVDGTKQVVTLSAKSVVGVSLADGKLLWQLPFVPTGRAYNAATPIIDGQTVIYTGAGRGTRAVKIEAEGDGFAAKELWSNPDVAPQYNTPVLKNGLLFGLSDRGRLFCLNAKNGETAWLDETAYGRGFAAILDVGPCLVALPSTSELIAFEPSAEGYEELAKIKVAETETYAHPVIAGNRVFVKDQNSLTLWTLP